MPQRDQFSNLRLNIGVSTTALVYSAYYLLKILVLLKSVQVFNVIQRKRSFIFSIYYLITLQWIFSIILENFSPNLQKKLYKCK